MTEREKLIELLSTAPQEIDGRIGIGKIADHLLRSGVIVPPCKVGDTVYYITGIHNTLVKGAKVEEIYVGEAGFAFRLCHNYTYFTLQQEDVFLTKEEADRALAERSEKE